MEVTYAGYSVFKLETGAWALAGAVGPEATAWTETGLLGGTARTYALTANDAHGASPLSASASAKPRAASPAAPVITVASTQLGWGSASLSLTYQPAGGSFSGYQEFRVYRKEQGLPVDRWELVSTDPVSQFQGQYFSQVLNRCVALDYVVGAVTTSGQETEDSFAYHLSWILEPRIPLVILPDILISEAGRIG